MEKIIVIANCLRDYKEWAFEQGIDLKSKDCEHRFMITDYSVRGILVKDVINISRVQTPETLRFFNIAIVRKNTQGELLDNLY